MHIETRVCVCVNVFVCSPLEHIDEVGFGTPARGKATADAVAAVQFTVYDATACEIFERNANAGLGQPVREPVRQSTDQSVG